MPTKSQAIKRFLQQKTHLDLANFYNIDMECQVNVAQDDGERITGDFKGKKWHGWSDGLTTWKSFRIPYNAKSDPIYTDYEIKYDLEIHAEAIGMTGWNWKKRVSQWVAFDFDALVGHSQGLTNQELDEVKKVAQDIDWVTIRYSTSGKGLHLYVLLDNFPTQNHNEHAALARAILGKMSALTGFDFNSKVDICGGNMWIWHRKMAGTNGLKIVKQGTVLRTIPPNWKDHLIVIKGKRRKNLPQNIDSTFEELAGQHSKIKLDDEHKKLIKFLKNSDCFWWWDQDNHLLVTHTIHLQSAFETLELKGHFKTISTGKEKGNDWNVFCFPLKNGAWVIRRFTVSVQEDVSWNQDSSGWTRCYLNKIPDLRTAALAYGGIEDPAGGFVFREAEIAQKAGQLLNVHFDLKPGLSGRETKLKQHKDGRLIIEINRNNHDEDMEGWLAKGNKPWTKIVNRHLTSASEPDIGNYDDLVRHLITESGDDYGWMLKSDAKWHTEPLTHLKIALGSTGLKPKEITEILGSAIFKSWKIVNIPFQPEYPGDRCWNRNAAQYKYTPSKDEILLYPTWLKILNHCGNGLTQAVQENEWAKNNGIITGADYLKCWIASLFQEPLQPLPYLFFYGPQNSGKSIFHEALGLLITKGYKRADAALISQAGFNAELEGSIICVVEETDLKSNRVAYNRIKDWVTSPDLLIHAKGKTPYHIPNATSWIQCSNDHRSCPVFPGDTRITMCYVEPLGDGHEIPKKQIIPLLIKEAPHFLAEILKLELLISPDRLNLPVILTEDKNMAQELNQTPLESFIRVACKYAPGYMIKFSDFYTKFIESLEPNDIHQWSKIRIGREVPPQYPKARSKIDNQYYFGNIAFANSPIKELKKLIIKQGYLEG